MSPRGQSSLDLLMALVILLVVLSSLSGIVNSFTSSQKEVGLHAQLGETGSSIRVFLAGSSLGYHAPLTYPTQNPLIPAAGLVAATDSYARVTGSMSLPPSRVSGYPQGVSCAVTFSSPLNALTLTSLAADVGLNNDVTTTLSTWVVSGFFPAHVIESDGCGSFFRVVSS